ncbi:sporulation protein YqfD [Clostridium sp.]|uniref:sporulation protein YqfD n=1 Tax=Clostridium sp. TaxID=1506 RepID=UPI0025BA2006|nr:sporulation protein YqfD [Clostridium sp.]MBS4958240.1 sporulation protein YqfD [Clostridium sp.]MDU4883629.1 sporulation protein YqfD [Clostridium celatum]MDU7076847.1 sporulation protein YqfD [Clostridium celatum]
MAFNKIKKGKILVEIKILNTEKLLNLFWGKNIRVYKVKKRDFATLILEIDYLNYAEVKVLVESLGGRINIIKSAGFVFFLGNIKKKLSLVIGGLMFLCIIYYLSTYIWAIEVDVQQNIPPFEIRKQLNSIGIKPGIPKNSIDVKEIEKQLENISSEILWLRVRIEGSTLKVVVEEKINPPQEQSYEYGNLVATMEGEVKRVYTFAGRAKVKSGQLVKVGDVVIEGIDGSEGGEYILPPRGMVIANTFYEKSMNVKVNGTTLERSGEKDSDIYINIFGKKIYIKKAIKDFEHYDKIEVSGKIFNKVLYYERVEKDINLSEDDAIEKAVNDLEKSLLNELSRDAKIVDKIVDKEMKDEENMLINVVFIVEQNIVSEDTVSY